MVGRHGEGLPVSLPCADRALVDSEILSNTRDAAQVSPPRVITTPSPPADQDRASGRAGEHKHGAVDVDQGSPRGIGPRPQHLNASPLRQEAPQRHRNVAGVVAEPVRSVVTERPVARTSRPSAWRNAVPDDRLRRARDREASATWEPFPVLPTSREPTGAADLQTTPAEIQQRGRPGSPHLDIEANAAARCRPHLVSADPPLRPAPPRPPFDATPGVAPPRAAAGRALVQVRPVIARQGASVALPRPLPAAGHRTARGACSLFATVDLHAAPPAGATARPFACPSTDQPAGEGVAGQPSSARVKASRSAAVTHSR